MLVPPVVNGGTSSSGSSNIQLPSRRHRRQSSLNTVSWPNQNELTVSQPQRRLSISPQAVTLSADVIIPIMPKILRISHY